MKNDFCPCNVFDDDCDCCKTPSVNLCRHVGKVVTIFTDSGGVSGCGFTGLVAEANSCFVKLVTSLPSAPPYPFANCGNRHNSCCFNWNRGSCGFCSRTGSAMYIPTCHIVSFVFNEV